MKQEYRIFITPKEVASFMQNAEGEVAIKKNIVFLNGIRMGEFHFKNKKDKSFFEQNTF